MRTPITCHLKPEPHILRDRHELAPSAETDLPANVDLAYDGLKLEIAP